MESPWSTPTQSEIGEAEQALNAKVANDFIMDSDPLAQREMGDGEPSFDANVDDFMANNSNQEDEEPSSNKPVRKSKKSPRGASKSPEKRASRSPTKGRKKKPSRLDPQAAGDDDNDSGSKSRKGSPTKRQARSTSRQPPPSSNAGSDVANTEELIDSPTKARRSPRKKRNPKKKSEVTNGDNSDEGVSSATTTSTRNNLSTANTDTSGISSQAPGSPTKEGPGSPTRSPTKSPRKRGSKARDVLTLPKPYSHLKSDQIKRWNKEMLEGKVVGADNEAELELFKSVNFTNALVLKINQLAKQGLMDKKTLFSFVILIARFKIPREENAKCLMSFFRFARELTTIRVAIHSPEQQQLFDDEVAMQTASWIPPIYPKPTNLQPQVDIRPETAKPKDPDSFDFKDEQVAKDYKKMWDKYNEMEALLKAKSEAENAEEEEDEDEE